jgi:hypothetical protein
MKNLVIIVLATVAVVALIEVSKMSDRASYWMNRCDAAEAVIDRVEDEQEDYVLDVLCEGDEWAYWLESGGDED